MHKSGVSITLFSTIMTANMRTGISFRESPLLTFMIGGKKATAKQAAPNLLCTNCGPGNSRSRATDCKNACTTFTRERARQDILSRHLQVKSPVDGARKMRSSRTCRAVNETMCCYIPRSCSRLPGNRGCSNPNKHMQIQKCLSACRHLQQTFNIFLQGGRR